MKEDLLDFWLPFALPFIPVLIWLRRRIRFLNVRGKNDNGFFLYQLVAIISISVPTIIAQGYIEALSSRLIHVNSPYEITSADKIDCYVINDFNVVKEYAGAHRTSRTSGRHNERLTFTTYIVVPLVDHSRQLNLTNHKYWYGFKFQENMSNHASDEVKNILWKAFYDECVKNFEQYDYSDYEYLQGLAYSDDRDGYIEAIKARQQNINTEDLIILEPIDEPFSEKAGNKLAWIFGTFGIGAFVFFIMVIIPSVNYSEYRMYKDKRPMQDDDLKDILKFIVPKDDHFITAFLINANLIVFILMVFSGINLVSATPDELLALGANRRFEVMNGESWRLFTSMFLHGGLMHIAMNLFGIGATCALVEPVLGRIRTLIAYILSGIGASLVSIYWHENTISVGASGAIFGMMGVMIALLFTKKDGGFGGMYLIILGLYGGVSLLFGLLGGIDNAAHIGGLLTGIIIGFILILSKWKSLVQTNI